MQADHRIRRMCHVCLGAGLTLLLAVSSATAQTQRPVHYFQWGTMPPGAIGQAQLLRHQLMHGYYQPVRVSVPQGARVSFAMEGTFDEGQDDSAMAGLLIGEVYRLRVSQIPLRPGLEVYPTIEVINRLYPPDGLATRFPIPIQISQEELDLAASGRFVTRVIYLEDPNAALPKREDPDEQRYFDVGPSQDPLKVADQMGRPMAILRMGSRVPDVDGATGRFMFQSPSLMRFAEPEVRDRTAPPAVEASPSDAPQASPPAPIRR